MQLCIESRCWLRVCITVLRGTVIARVRRSSMFGEPIVELIFSVACFVAHIAGGSHCVAPSFWSLTSLDPSLLGSAEHRRLLVKFDNFCREGICGCFAEADSVCV